MVSQIARKSSWDTLSSISRVASSLRQKLVDLNIPITDHPLPQNIDNLIPRLVLTVPHDVLAPLSALDIPDNLRQVISQRLNRFIGELQIEYISKYRHTCLETLRVTNSANDVAAVHQTYQALSQRQFLPTIRSHISFVVAEVTKHQSTASANKRPFNIDFTPVLEKYFEFNGYPTVIHRTILAQKSSMTPRQIEVWFQNHRKRARQDGKVVRRLDSDVPLKRALSISSKSTESYQLRLLTPSDDGMISDNTDEETDVRYPERRKLASCLEETDETDEDDKFRPPHAYPTTRKSQHEDPFPNDHGVFRFPPPAWPRKPATTPIIPMAVDMDDFARTFHMKLNFINSPWKRESTPSKLDLPSFTSWFAPSRTIPSPAPLPALMRKRASPPVSSSIMLPLALDPTIFDFGAKSKTPGISCVVKLPYGPVPSASFDTNRLAPANEASKRAISPLPRRAPNGPTPSVSSNTTNLLAPPGEAPRRKVSPLPRRAPSNSQLFGSRTSSFSSDTSYMSSSSDDSSPSPSTPPPLPDQTLFSEFEILMQSEDSTNISDAYTSQIFDISSQTFDFTFSKSSNDQSSSLLNSPGPLFQGYTPLIPTC